MSQGRRQQVLLALLVAVLATTVWWRFGSRLAGDGDAGRRRPAAIGSSSRPGSTGEAELPEVVELRLDDLQAVSGDLEQGRDPFHESRPETAPSPSEASQSALREAMERARREQEAEAAAPLERAVPRPPSVDVVFLGSFGSDNNRLAVFTDGSEIFNVGEGDVLKNKFVVVRIGFESADVGFVGFPETPARRLEIGG